MAVYPFVGENYGTPSPPFGLSILVLGESSYKSKRGEPLPSEHNKNIIDCVRSSSKDNTITRAAGVFYGEWRSWEQRREFWQSAAFANFVQADMGHHGERPSNSEWADGVEPFQEYLKTLKPEFVLALGDELWGQLPLPCSRGHVYQPLSNEPRPYYLYDNGGGVSFVFGITHPSYRRGWSYERWTPWVKAALRTVREIKCT
jgi:hypothetical protein